MLGKQLRLLPITYYLLLILNYHIYNLLRHHDDLFGVLPSIHFCERSSANTAAWMASEAASASNSMLKRAFPLKEMV